MRCIACNVILQPHEDSRKYKATGEELALCDKCLSPIEGEVDVITDQWEVDEPSIFEDEDTIPWEHPDPQWDLVEYDE